MQMSPCLNLENNFLAYPTSRTELFSNILIEGG